MDPLVLALAREGPRHVSEFLLLFRAALSHHLDVDYPERTENAYLLSDLYVGPTNKRHLVFYVGVGNTRDSVTRVTRVDYTMPLSPKASKAFGIRTDVPVPPEGPEFTNIPLAGRTASAAVASNVATLVAAADPRNRIATWQSEITRLRGVHAGAADGSELKKKAAQLLRFWIEMYKKIDIEIAREYILAPGTRTPRARALRLRARTRRAAAPPAPNVPLGPVVASSSSSSGPRRHVSAPMLSSQSSTPRRRTRRLPRDPVTGKIIRARQPYSDPRSSSTDRPLPLPVPPPAGPRMRPDRPLDRNILYNARGIAFHPSESESEGSDSEEIVYQGRRRRTTNSSDESSDFENIF